MCLSLHWVGKLEKRTLLKPRPSKGGLNKQCRPRPPANGGRPRRALRQSRQSLAPSSTRAIILSHVSAPVQFIPSFNPRTSFMGAASCLPFPVEEFATRRLSGSSVSPSS
ncbi:hypothetical protein J6590_040123 [Homalodisca vitripennis]|nr:hypothetical protein J6590_088697 [Homalodisca vitripennis]KAG8311578.1 hypothetical protein J6590_040123 [Homalodisca vitripennis]